ESQSVVQYFNDSHNPGSIGNNSILNFLQDDQGRMWLGTLSGLDMCDGSKNRNQKTFIHFKNNPKQVNSVSGGMILSLLEDHKHRLWIGVENSGLDMLDLATFQADKANFQHHRNSSNKETSLSSNSVHSLFLDKQENIWIGTLNKGINIITPVGDKFELVQNEPENPHSLKKSQVNVFLDDNEYLWIGTEAGLERYNKKDRTVKHFIHDPLKPSSIGANAVWALCKDRNGTIWVGTWGGGLNQYNDKTETFNHFFNDPKNTNSIGRNDIFSIIEDSKGYLWLGTMGGGLNLFDPQKKLFTRYLSNDSSVRTQKGLRSNYVQQVIETRDGDLWFSNTTAFVHYNRMNGSFEQIVHDENDNATISSTKVICLFEDSRCNLWFGTDDGLNLYDRKTKAAKVYRIADGLPNNSINSILEDNHGNLWISSNGGISKFVDAIHLPSFPKFRNYSIEDGLQNNQFTRRSAFKCKDGKMYFGGIDGFNAFYPDKIVDNTYVPPIVITEFRIFNQPVLPSEIKSILKQDISIADQINLTYKQSVFSFEFAALNYISSSKNQYAYKMEGFDDDWNYVGNKHSAVYTNLNPGDYTFYVKGSNNDGVWNTTGASIRINIAPPFWQTTWFRLLAAGLFSGIIYWIIRRRKQMQKIAEQRRIDKVISQERNLLRTLIDNVPDLIYVKDTAGRKTISNQADELFEDSLRNTSNPTDDQAEVIVTHSFDEQSILQAGQPVLNMEETLSDNQGKKHWYLTSKIPLRDENRNIIGLVSIARDITQRKKAEIEREHVITELQEALADIKKLSGLVPICSNCKKIRDDKGYWNQVEAYIQDRSEARFTHGICPDCMKKLYPDFLPKKEQI
ncbi:MAG TPA: two-component regulator propeller domain-containing protein, partial [Bacteroidota bacterium]|nr:two-component regulator propeller domain-containing protein [Bacteroidota bacterium]